MRLTPKAADLLHVFLKHPGDILDRGFLMRQVWDTDYIGDTRTIDVHVRWVREAIEADPTAPTHIVTVRGIGYRFEPYPDGMNSNLSNGS
jgi:DNA-binding response OmpR family regulator